MIRHLVLWFGLACVVAGSSAQVPTSAPAWLPAEYSYTQPFFDEATYDATVATPRQILGFDLGDRPVRHAEVQRCLAEWSKSPRLKSTVFGYTHERREQVYAVVTSAGNHAKLADIRERIGKLADPRRLKDDAEAKAIIDSTPAIAWMAYCIHGDELSGTDAALALIYHLVAATDDETRKLLDETIVVVDPLQNPDGRDRFITMCDEAAGYTPNLDSDAVQHAGRWPRGRTNHYFFDMNRDWIYGTQPETRARHAAIAAWTPQLMVDGHEMGPDTTFLFNPAREPFNPGLSPTIRKWWMTFADDAGKAFDAHGWSFYTREWADFWYPGYSDGWATLHGVIGILYEQARTGGRAIRLNTGRILTYREAVHHQVLVSWANLKSLRANRREILTDYLAMRRAALRPDESLPRTFILPIGDNPTRVHAFAAYLANQGIEVGVAKAAFDATDLTSQLRRPVASREFPAGTLVVHRPQPLSPLVEAALGFDPRMDKEFLETERRELETRRQTRSYDVTGWSPPMAWNVESYWAKDSVSVATTPYAAPAGGALLAPAAKSPYAWAIDGRDDSVLRAAAHLLQAGVVVRVAEKEFRVGGELLPRGSLLIRRHDNGVDVFTRIEQAAAASGATVRVAETARSPDETPDLGGEHFLLLRTPRIALVGDGGGDPSNYGAMWHLLDCEIGLAVSLQDESLRGVDLRRFNVIILPGAAGPARNDELAAWVRAGGTLIAIEAAAAALADEKAGLSAVRRRPDVLKSLDEYLSWAAVERNLGQTEVNVDELFDDVVEKTPPADVPVRPETKLSDEALEEWRQIFSPQGLIVRGTLNTDHWLTFGCSKEIPLFAAGSTVLLSKPPVMTPVRFAESKELRLSGLLWPEANVRLAGSAYATVESVGSGQVILFAHDPNFRGAWRGTQRLLLNAILLGPGCGTSQPNP